MEKEIKIITKALSAKKITKKDKMCVQNNQNCTRGGDRPMTIAQKSCCARGDPPLVVQLLYGGDHVTHA